MTGWQSASLTMKVSTATPNARPEPLLTALRTTWTGTAHRVPYQAISSYMFTLGAVQQIAEKADPQDEIPSGPKPSYPKRPMSLTRGCIVNPKSQFRNQSPEPANLHQELQVLLRDPTWPMLLALAFLAAGMQKWI